MLRDPSWQCPGDVRGIGDAGSRGRRQSPVDLGIEPRCSITGQARASLSLWPLKFEFCCVFFVWLVWFLSPHLAVPFGARGSDPGLPHAKPASEPPSHFPQASSMRC